MFGRRKRTDPDQAMPIAPAEVYRGLRSQVLNLDPATVGITSSDHRSTWGCLMETGYQNGSATLVCLSDGTTSLYTSSGGGIIGGGAHEAVVEQTAKLLHAIDEHLPEMTSTVDQHLPTDGQTVIRALTMDGQRTFEAAEVELGEGRSVMSPVFYAAHAVITQLRLIDEAPR